jgi:exopolysaccharide biosynthesis polyprenyl glycosylphosphotransferase
VTQSRVRTLYIVSKMAADAVMTMAAFALAYQLRILVPFPTEPVQVAGFLTYIPMMLVQATSVLVVFYFNKLYHIARAVSRVDEVYSIFGAVSIATMMAVAISALTFKNSIFELDYPRAMILYAWLLAMVFIALGRELHRRTWHRLRMRGVGRDRALVVGSGETAQAIVNKIQWSPYLGYELVGVVNFSLATDSTNGGSHAGGGAAPEKAAEIIGAMALGKVDELAEVIEKHHVEEVIVALPEGSSRRDMVKIVSMCQRGSVQIRVFPDLFEFVTTGVTIDDLGGIPLLNVRDIQLRGWKLSLKRVLDFLGAAAGLILLSPLLMLFALLIWLESPGPVFYAQERMGLDGRPFLMIKFRTMRQDAEQNGPGWTVKNDPRRTRFGAWLRAQNIDELPQLINVLLGDMSLVGPRPERPVYVQQFRQSIPRYMERHREKAGMTGWAQVNGLRGDTSISERTKYDLWYIENWSLWLDIRIILRTILQMVFVRGRNAY